MHKSNWALSPEEDVIAAMLDEADDLDDSLPADLWFRSRNYRRPIVPRTLSCRNRACT
ncbi:MAG: hypothetical protein ACRDHN_08340 [Thermomicrobiales bacterium]